MLAAQRGVSLPRGDPQTQYARPFTTGSPADVRSRQRAVPRSVGWVGSRLVDGAVQDTREPLDFNPELFLHEGVQGNVSWARLRSTVRLYWDRVLTSAGPAASSVPGAIGFVWLHSQGLERNMLQWASFCQTAGVQPIVLVRQRCLEHYVSASQFPWYAMNEHFAQYITRDLTRKGETVTIHHDHLRSWCDERNAYYDQLRSELPEPLLLTYEAMARDPAATLACILDHLGLPPPVAVIDSTTDGADMFSPLKKVHRLPIHDYINNAAEVQGWGTQRWDYNHIEHCALV
jgi:hypothetical protein